ncbi:hypothetical protein ACLOJK_022217 [Asimina triloba]
MLAKAPLKLHESSLFPFFFAREQKKRCPTKSQPFSVRAAFTRKPTGTAGAYQLIDNDTGEKFFVWGGSDEGPDSPIPSKQVLSWKPDAAAARSSHKGGEEEEIEGGNGMDGAEPYMAANGVGNGTAQKGIFASSFGRLKAQRVRALIKKTSQKKGKKSIGVKGLDSARMFSGPSDGSDSEDEYDSNSEDEFVAREYEYEGGNLASAEPQINKDHEMNPDTNHSDVAPKYKLKQPSENPITSAEAREWDSVASKLKVASPKATSSLRGWSNSSSYQRDVTYLSKKWNKKSAGDGFYSRKSFKDLGCSEDMIESLKAQLFIRPSHIQAMAYLPVSKGKSCIIADQSGSGKTLAYLAPVIQRLRIEELQGVSRSSPGKPRVVVLVPTAELASQVLSNCRSISKFGVPFRSMVATGGFRQKTQLENLQQELDVLIATPGHRATTFTVLHHDKYGAIILDCASPFWKGSTILLFAFGTMDIVVLDEVDILFGDDGFEQVLQSLINAAPVTTQYLFATATLPVDIYNKLVEVFPDCEVIMGPGMHRTSSGLQEVLVDCSGDNEQEKTPENAFLNKRSALLQLVEETPVPKTIVFCNKIETCRKVENILKRIDRKGHHIRVLPFHAALAQESRLANMKEFLGSQSKDSMFLICTDRASRGIDFANVDHVVLFDFPRDPSEYVRRVGRTARGAGGKGKAFAFVVGKQVSLARRIMERNQKGHPLHDVPAAYELTSSVL